MASRVFPANSKQHQPITTALRQICESYPAGTCLRELLQNADDAEATEIEYVLDTNTYTAEPLLYGGLREFQGPALLARNNRTFSDKDFASLASIGDSRKRQGLAATGKFGQGFNSVRLDASSKMNTSANTILSATIGLMALGFIAENGFYYSTLTKVGPYPLGRQVVQPGM